MPLLLLALACGGPGLTPIWDTEAGDHRPVPAVGQDLLVSSTSFPTSGNREIQARDKDFADLWDYTDEGGSRPLTLDSSEATLLGGDGRVIALDTSGTEAWRAEIEGTSDQVFAVDGDVVYAAMNGDDDGIDSSVSALLGGEVQWSYKVEGTPHALAVGRDGIVFAVTGEWLYALDADGDLVWETQLDGAGFRLALGRDTVLVSHSVRVRAFNRGTGEMEWVHRMDSAREPAVGSDGTVYLGGGEEGLRAVDGRTGDVLWQLEYSFGPVAIGADGQLYTMGLLPDVNQDVWQFAVLSATTGEIAWQDAPWPHAGYVLDAPALDEGRAYFAAGDRLFAFEGAALLADGPWPRAGGGNANRRRELD